MWPPRYGHPKFLAGVHYIDPGHFAPASDQTYQGLVEILPLETGMSEYRRAGAMNRAPTKRLEKRILEAVKKYWDNHRG